MPWRFTQGSAALSPSEKFHELLDGEPGIGDDSAERARSDLLVIGNDDPGVRLVAAEDHVAAGLAAEDEPSALKSTADLKARQIGGELGHVAIFRDN